MKERKNIDRLFQEKFRDFTPEPREEVWQNIAGKLNEKEGKKAFLIPLWAKVGGVAALLALMLSGYFFTQNNTTQTQVVFEIEETAKPTINFPTLKDNSSFTQASEILKKLEQSPNASIPNNQLAKPNTAIAAEDNTEKTTSENPENSDKLFSSEATENNTAIAEENKQNDSKPTSGSKKPSEASKLEDSAHKNNAEAIAAEDSEENNSTIEEEKLPGKIPNALAELEKENSLKDEEERIAEASRKKMRISTFAAPVFYDNLGSGNAIDPEFAGNSTKSEVSMAYGMNLAYAISDKIKIRSGISKVAMSYNTEDILFSPGVVASDIKSINYDNKSNHYQLNNAESGMQGSPNTDNSVLDFSPTSRSLPGELNQRFGFIEVPLEIEYNLLDRKIGLNIIAGGSSLFLDENSVKVNANNQQTRLGEANNLNKVSFSTNIGVGLDYKLTDSFLLNLEPIFKYQLNTFNDTDGVHPFYFGIYSGVSFKF